jgi:hypothetical protein
VLNRVDFTFARNDATIAAAATWRRVCAAPFSAQTELDADAAVRS